MPCSSNASRRQILHESPQLRHVSVVGSSSMASLWHPGQRRRTIGRLSAARCFGVVPPHTPDFSLFVIAHSRHAATISQRLHAASAVGLTSTRRSSAKKRSGSIVRQTPRFQSGNSPTSFLTTALDRLEKSLEEIGGGCSSVHRRLRDVPLVQCDLRLPRRIGLALLGCVELDLLIEIASLPEFLLGAELDGEVTLHDVTNGTLTCIGAIFSLLRQREVLPVQLRVRRPTLCLRFP